MILRADDFSPSVLIDALKRIYPGREGDHWYAWTGRTTSGSSVYPVNYWIPILTDGLRDFDRDPEPMTHQEALVIDYLEMMLA